MPVNATEDLSFEDAFSRLEDAVMRLEAGGLNIEDMVARFEEGMALVKLCYAKLDVAQARVKVLLGENGEIGSEESGTDEVEADDEPR